MKNLLITICLGSMFVSANAMDDFDPVMDTTIFSIPQRTTTFSIPRQSFDDDDYDPVMDTTIFFHLSNNPPVLNNLQPNDDDFDPVMDTTTFSIPQQSFDDDKFSEILNSSLENSQKQALKKALTPLLINTNDKVVLMTKDNVPVRNSDGEQTGYYTNLAEYVPSWFADKFTDERNFDIDRLQRKQAKWIMCYQNPNSGERTLLKMIVDDEIREYVAHLAIEHSIFKDLFHLAEGSNREISSREITSCLDHTISNLYGPIIVNTVPFMQDLEMDPSIVQYFKTPNTVNAALAVKLLLEVKKYDNEVKDFLAIFDFSNMDRYSVNRRFTYENILENFSAGSGIAANAHRRVDTINSGNDYAKRVFFKALKALFDYNNSETLQGLYDFMYDKYPLIQTRNGAGTEGLAAYNLLSTTREGVRAYMGSHERNAPNEQTLQRIAGYLFELASVGNDTSSSNIATIFFRAYVKMFNVTYDNRDSNALDHDTYVYFTANQNYVGANDNIFEHHFLSKAHGGVSGDEVCPVYQTRYLFRGLEKLLEKADQSIDPTEKDRYLTSAAKVIGYLIQGFSHCDSGVSSAINSIINEILMPEETDVSYRDLLQSTLTQTSNSIFSILFQYKICSTRADAMYMDAWTDYSDYYGSMDHSGIYNNDGLLQFVEGLGYYLDARRLQLNREAVMAQKYARCYFGGDYGLAMEQNDSDVMFNSMHFLNLHLVSFATGNGYENDIKKSALDALYKDSEVRQFGISKIGQIGNRAYSWAEFDLTPIDVIYDDLKDSGNSSRFIGRMNKVPGFYINDFTAIANSDEYDDDAMNMIKTYYNRTLNNNERINDASYKYMIDVMFSGVMKDMNLVLSIAIENPMTDRVLKFCFSEKLQHPEFKDMDISGFFASVFDNDEELLTALKKRMLFNLMKNTNYTIPLLSEIP